MKLREGKLREGMIIEISSVRTKITEVSENPCIKEGIGCPNCKGYFKGIKSDSLHKGCFIILKELFNDVTNKDCRIVYKGRIKIN